MTSDSTATGHYGPGFDPTKNKLVSFQKEGRCCQGTYSSEWYGLFSEEEEIYPRSSFVFCEYCAKNSMKGRVRKFTKEEIEPYKDRKLDCSMSKDLLHLNIKRKVFSSQKLVSVNVNITDPNDTSVFAPAPLLRGKKADTAAELGAAIAPLPSGCYPEMSIRCYGQPYDNYYMVTARTGTGKVLCFLDDEGRQYYTHCSKPFIIDSFVEGGKRILYTVASRLERDAEIAPEHEDMSNKFFITVTIYKKQKKVEPEETMWRTPPTMRGGGSTMRGGGSIKGGATYEAEGFSKMTKTQTTDDIFVEKSRHELTVQFVNTETEEILVREATKIQTQVEEFQERELEELRRQLAEKEEAASTERKSVIRGHAAQAAALI